MAADVSPRHLSFIETGRSEPSREMVLLLAEVLDIPLTERNALLESAGFAALFRRTDLSDPELKQIRHLLTFLIGRHEPYPAIVFDGRHDVVMANNASLRFISTVLDPVPDWYLESPNALKLMYHPEGLRRVILNWEELASTLLARAERELVGPLADRRLAGLLREIRSWPGVPKGQVATDPRRNRDILLPVRMRWQGQDFQLFTTLAAVGTPQDATLAELRLETFLPADEASEAILLNITQPEDGPVEESVNARTN